MSFESWRYEPTFNTVFICHCFFNHPEQFQETPAQDHTAPEGARTQREQAGRVQPAPEQRAGDCRTDSSRERCPDTNGERERETKGEREDKGMHQKNDERWTKIGTPRKKTRKRRKSIWIVLVVVFLNLPVRPNPFAVKQYVE